MSQPHLVGESKFRAGIVELDAHPVALTWRQQRGLFVTLAMREVEHAIADTQRFTDGYTSHNRTTRFAIGRSDATSSVTIGAPRISIGASSRGVSKVSEQACVFCWSPA